MTLAKKPPRSVLMDELKTQRCSPVLSSSRDAFDYFLVKAKTLRFVVDLICAGCFKVGVDVKGSHVYRAWGEMYRQSMAFRDPSGCSEGLLFIAFSRKLQELEDALNR